VFGLIVIVMVTVQPSFPEVPKPQVFCHG